MSLKRMGLVLALLLLLGACSGCQPVLDVLDAVSEQRANGPETEMEMVEIIEVPPQEASAQGADTPVVTPGPSHSPAPAAPPVKTSSASQQAVSMPAPTVQPTAKPTEKPTAKPAAEPTAKPAAEPTAKPAAEPTAKPTAKPTEKPTAPPQTPAPTPAAPIPTPEPIPITIFADPTPAPTPEPVAAAGDHSSSSADRIFAMTNQQRAANGLGELRESSALQRAARTRAQELTVSFSHTRPDGSSALSISSAAYAENIAYGLNMSDADIMNGWMNSSGHRANILNPSYSTIGVGCYTLNGYVYYVQLFGY